MNQDVLRTQKSESVCQAHDIHLLNQQKEYTAIATFLETALLTDQSLPAKAIQLWKLLYSKARFDDELSVRVSIDWLAEQLGRSRRQTQRYVQTLVLADYLVVKSNFRFEKAGQLTNTYFVRFPQHLVESAKKESLRGPQYYHDVAIQDLESWEALAAQEADGYALSPSMSSAASSVSPQASVKPTVTVSLCPPPSIPSDDRHAKQQDAEEGNEAHQQSGPDTVIAIKPEAKDASQETSLFESDDVTGGDDISDTQYNKSTLSSTESYKYKNNIELKKNKINKIQDCSKINTSEPVVFLDEVDDSDHENRSTDMTQAQSEPCEPVEKADTAIETQIKTLDRKANQLFRESAETQDYQTQVALYEQIRELEAQKYVLAHQLKKQQQQANKKRMQGIRHQRLCTQCFAAKVKGDRAVSTALLKQTLTRIQSFLGEKGSELVYQRMNEVIYAVRFGSLVLSNQSQKPMSLRHSINIAIKLLKNGQWDTPSDFDAWFDQHQL